MKHITSALLAALMLASLASCGDASTDTTVDSTADTTAAVVTEAATPSLLDDLGERDLGGMVYTIFDCNAHSAIQANIPGEEMTGDVVNDAMFTRNQAVEERLGITLAEVTTKGNSDNIANFNAYIQSDLMSGSHEFQLIGSYSLTVTAAAVNGYLYDLLDSNCEYLNFDQPWWPDTLLEQATINNKLCFASGDISMNTLYMMYVCFVNTDMIETYKLEDPAQLVLDSKWTYDKFIEMCNGVYEDLNGNGTKDYGDRFGYMTSGIHVDPWFYGTGAVMALQDANGDLQIADSFSSEITINAIDKVNALLYDTNDGIYTSSVQHQKAFRDEQLLFCMDRARVSFKVLADNENCHYTIVPCPKYDEAQERYYTVMGNPFTLYAIPKDSQDPAMASAVMECFASESYRTTTPAVFEITLKLKYAQDDITGQMYDMIRQNVSFDIGRIFSSSLIGQGLFRNSISGNRNTWASDVKANLKPLEKKLEKLTAAFE